MIVIGLISLGFVCVLCVGVFHVLKGIFRDVYYTHKVPGAVSRSFLLGELTQLTLDEAVLFERARSFSKAYGPLYHISATFLVNVVNISGAEELEKIVSTTKHIKKALIYTFVQKWLGEGLLTSSGSKWHSRRKILTPAFHFNILQQFLSIFNKETKKLLESLNKETEKPWTNVVPLISDFTLNSMAETSMGTPLNLQNKEDKNYVSAIYRLGQLVIYRTVRPWMYPSFLYYKLFPKGREEIRLIKTLHSFTEKIMTGKSRNFETFEVPDAEDNFNYSKRKKLAFLDLLLNAKFTNGTIDDEGIKEEVNTFMFEGHDTTSSAICFILMLLANYPEYQEQIYQEIVYVLGDSDNDPTTSDLNELKFMERFIKESLRLYPSVPSIGRVLDDDVVVNGYLLPKYTTVFIHICDIHKNPKYWPNPEVFDPSRFLPSNSINRHPFAYVPFSAGPRNCIGQKFALLEIKAVLCGVLRHFVLEPVDTPKSIKLVLDIILRTTNGSIKVKFRRRNEKSHRS